MNCYYNGTIWFTRELTKEEVKKIEEINPFFHGSELYIHENEIEFNEYLAGDIEYELKQLEKLVHSWKEIKIDADSTVTYTGDYEGGYIYTEEEGFVNLDEDDYIIKTALDKKLIDELVSRGYAVKKNVPSPHGLEFGKVVWTEEDIRNYIEDEDGELPQDEEFIDEVLTRCMNDHHFTDSMIEAGWETIAFYAYEEAEAWKKSGKEGNHEDHL